jgi:hypothetical protein
LSRLITAKNDYFFRLLKEIVTKVMQFITPLELEKEINALHDDKHRDADHAVVMEPDGRIYMTKGRRLFGMRSQFTIGVSLHANLKLENGYVCLPPDWSQEQYKELHKRLGIALALQTLHFCGAFPDSEANCGDLERMLLENEDYEAVSKHVQEKVHDKWTLEVKRAEKPVGKN